MLHVEPIPILDDNYAWLLRCPATGATAVADPAVAAPVLARVQALGGRLDWILLTHHHGDHVAEVPQVAAATGARVAGHAADAHRLPSLDLAVKPGETFTLGEAAAQVLDTPGHTRGHIAWAFVEGQALLCGDTLFSIGCGRLLEGTAAEMFASLRALAALPDAMRVCCGHEYTLSNLRYARHVEPDNQALAAHEAEVKARRARGEPSLPTTLGLEKALNPFLRARDVAELAALRSGKDDFR
ncbi:hydroxyacylglutathione hydrolase [Roseococcus sp. DSY-14]|uniref:hydroxyacylglutathione hydrolase n=1 Tax=Roseococcus sp. DSY-14 TaxID=3369650 RepID=UPI00387B42A3